MPNRNTDWLTKYIHLMISDEVDSAMGLKIKYIPRSLFKFRKLDDYTLESIRNKEFWLSEIDSLNDPFEGFLVLDINKSVRQWFSTKQFPINFKKTLGVEITTDEINSIVISNEPFNTFNQIIKSKGIVLKITAEEHQDLLVNQWRKIIDDAKRSVRICSFSESNDSLLMWSHYAFHHQGVCVEYDFLDDNEKDAELLAFFHPAVYSDTPFQINTLDELNFSNKVMGSLTKSKQWEYEAEWRITLPIIPWIKRTKIKSPTPKTVYLGSEFTLNDPEMKRKLFEVCELYQIPTIQMKRSPSEYKVIQVSQVKS